MTRRLLRSLIRPFAETDVRLCQLVNGHDWFDGYTQSTEAERIAAMKNDWSLPHVKQLVWSRFRKMKAEGRCEDLDVPWAVQTFGE